MKNLDRVAQPALNPLFHLAARGLALLPVLTLSACANLGLPAGTTAPASTAPPQVTSASTIYTGYGVVQAVELVKLDRSGLGVGTLAGAVVGGLVGSQVGSGSGKTAATVLGAAGGAYLGHEMEKQSQSQSDAYKLTVRMQDGTVQTVTQVTPIDVRVGDRVWVDSNGVRRY